MLHRCLEAPPETERVWGGLCTQLKVLEIPSCYHGVEFLRKDLKGRAKVYVYPNGNEGKRKPRRQPKEPIRLVK
jgi:hypothetical protein